MQVDLKPPVADEADPSGTKPDGGKEAAKDTVKYESYAKLLDEKKKLQAKFDELEKERSQVEESKRKALEEELKAKDDWKKLVGLRDQENETLKQENAKLKADIEEQGARRSNALKMRSFLDALPGKLDEQYWPLVKLDEVVLNPETGLPEASSVQSLAKTFQERYPLVIQRADTAKLPNDAPRGASGKLSYDQWLKLPYKEKLERQKDVDFKN